MKLRFKGNSIRLRLTQTEVESLNNENMVEETVDLGGNGSTQLLYSLKKSEDGFDASFENGELRVSIPQDVMDAWINGPDVGIDAVVGKVSLLVEKDFECLKPRPWEDQSDKFPHPKAGEVC